MLNKVFENKGTILSNKARRARWGPNLSSLITINPDLSDKNPLWNRSSENLSSILIYGLTPNQLQKKLEIYWQQPNWRQWFQYLFTSIQHQQEAWSYYQQCLAFREILRRNPSTQNLSIAIRSSPSQDLIAKLASWLSTIDLQFESYISKQNHWKKKHFEVELIKHDMLRKNKFNIKLNKELKEFLDLDHIQLKKEINQSYKVIEDMMNHYLLMWYQFNFHSPYLTQPMVTERNIVLLPGPSGTSRITRPIQLPSTRTTLIDRSEKGLSILNPTYWISHRRTKIIACLENKNQQSIKEAKHLLAESLKILTNFIDPQLECYRDAIKQTLLGKIRYKAALEFTQHLQSRLIKCYRQGSLLFHPDRNQDLLAHDIELSLTWNKTFQIYKQHWNTSLVELESSQFQLKNYIEQRSEYDKERSELLDFYIKLNEQIDAMALQLQTFQDEMKLSLDKIKEDCLHDRRTMKETHNQVKKKIEESRAQIGLEIQNSRIEVRKEIDEYRKENLEMAKKLDLLFKLLPNNSTLTNSDKQKPSEKRSGPIEKRYLNQVRFLNL